MGDEKDSKALEELKQTVVETAAASIVGTMTPAMMRRCAEEILETVLSAISTDKYSDLATMIKKKSTEAMAAYLQTDQATSLIKAAVHKGVNDALMTLSEEVKGKVIDTALRGMVKALIEPQQRRY